MYEEFFEMTHTPFVRGIPVDNLYEDQDTEKSITVCSMLPAASFLLLWLGMRARGRQRLCAA